eukprot:358881-Chlamydomonas_euryale.AAC.4
MYVCEEGSCGVGAAQSQATGVAGVDTRLPRLSKAQPEDGVDTRLPRLFKAQPEDGADTLHVTAEAPSATSCRPACLVWAPPTPTELSLRGSRSAARACMHADCPHVLPTVLTMLMFTYQCIL